jgi:hypothetical protein
MGVCVCVLLNHIPIHDIHTRVCMSESIDACPSRRSCRHHVTITIIHPRHNYHHPHNYHHVTITIIILIPMIKSYLLFTFTT